MEIDVLEATAAGTTIILDRVHPPSTCAGSKLSVPILAPADNEGIGGRSFERAENDEKVTIFGKRTLRVVSPKSSAQVEEVCYWIAAWFQTLLIGLAVAVAIVASQIAFGAVGKLVAVIWTLVTRIVRVFGLI